MNPRPLGPEPSTLPAALHPDPMALNKDSFCIIMIRGALVKRKRSIFYGNQRNSFIDSDRRAVLEYACIK